MERRQCCIGVMAYNEEANIGKLLDALLHQDIQCCKLREIVVVASGCTDRTVEISREWANRDSRIRVIVQKTREGKASAINEFITYARSLQTDLLVLESADTLPADGQTMERLLAPFSRHPDIGMTGAHPVPINPRQTFIGFVVHLQWNLHHRIALCSPKLGELVAFRNVIPGIPPDTAVDEAAIEALLVPQGYRLMYVPDALVYNKGPDTVKDFLIQRRRIAAGHIHLQATQNHVVSTMNPWTSLKMLRHELSWTPKLLLWTLGAMSLEAYGRFLGYTDFYVKRKNPFKWDMAETTKRLQ